MTSRHSGDQASVQLGQPPQQQTFSSHEQIVSYTPTTASQPLSQRTPDHLYQTSADSIVSSKYPFASSAGLEASDIDSMYMARPEDLLSNMHHHLQLQQAQPHQQQQQYQQRPRQQQQHQQQFQSSIDPMQDLALLSAFDPYSVPSTPSSSATPSTDLLATTTPTYLSFLPSFPTLPPSTLPLSLSSLPLSSHPAGLDQDEEGSHGNPYFVDSSYGLIMGSRRSEPLSSASSSKSSSPSASSSIVSSPVSTYFDESTVMLPAITACASCKRSHIKCDSGRPCQNCLKHPTKALTCRDATPKPRGRPKGGSKAAAEAIMLARLYQQQHQHHQQQLHLQEQLRRHQQQLQQPGYVPRPRVMSLPKQARPRIVTQQLDSQGYSSLNYQQAHSSRSSPASPAAVGHRAIRLGRRPSLPTWHHPYAMSSSPLPSSVVLSSSSPFVASPTLMSSHLSLSSMKESSVGAWAGSFAGFPTLPSQSTPATLVMTSMAQEFSHPSAVSATRSMVFTHQGPESLPLLQQQQQRLGGTLSRPPSIVESNDPQAWLPLQMLQQSLPPPPPSSKALVSSSAASSPSIKQTPSEERELIKEEDEGEEAYMRMDTVSIARYSSMSMNKQEEDEYVLESEQGHRSMETLLQQQHEMQVELQFLQQRQQVLQQEQFQREQALVRLSLQKNKRKQHRQQQQRSNHGSVPFF